MNLESLAQSLEKFNKLLPFLGLIFSTLVLLAGAVIYDINPFHMLKRIVAEQQGFDYAEQQRQFQQQVVANHVALGQAFLDDQLYDQAGDEFGKALAIDKLHVDAQIGRFIVEAARQIKQDFRPQAVERQLDPVVDCERLRRTDVRVDELDRGTDRRRVVNSTLVAARPVFSVRQTKPCAVILAVIFPSAVSSPAACAMARPAKKKAHSAVSRFISP